jgi:hypothetical protein
MIKNDYKERLKNKLEKLTNKEIDKVYKKLSTVVSNLKISKGRKITILLSEVSKDRDNLSEIYIKDLENAIKEVIRERSK